MARTFESKPATREQTPLSIGIVGPSSSGKTFSALRLATGIQRVTGGDIHVIDSEARRALHYAGRFKFVHTPFGAPFSPLDYLAVIDHCVKRGARTIVVDSASHEHEGPGGVLEWHEREMGGNFAKQMIAWAKPKAARRRLINTMTQLPVNFILCFRAKEKIKPAKKGAADKEPTPLGWSVIGGDEWIYEMTAHFLLLPGSDGTPVFESDMPNERALVKRPEQFREILSRPAQLSEDIGEAMAKWAAGDTGVAKPKVTMASLLSSYAACSDAATWRATEAERESVWGKCSPENKAKLMAASESAQRRIAESEADTGFDGDAQETPAETEPPVGALTSDQTGSEG